MTTQESLARARAGDAAAFEGIVREWSGKIYGLAFRMTGDPDASEEIAQETFVRAHAGIHSFRGEASVGTWLYRIAANLCFARSASAGRTVPIEEAAEIRAFSPGPETLTEAREIGARIGAAVAALPDRERAVFVLREFEGRSHAEIAGILGMAENTAKVHYFHAVRALRRRLEDLR